MIRPLQELAANNKDHERRSNQAALNAADQRYKDAGRLVAECFRMYAVNAAAASAATLVERQLNADLAEMASRHAGVMSSTMSQLQTLLRDLDKVTMSGQHSAQRLGELAEEHEELTAAMNTVLSTYQRAREGGLDESATAMALKRSLDYILGQRV